MSFESSDGQNQSKELQKNLEKKGVSGEFTEQELTNIGDLGLNFKKEWDIDPKEVDTKISSRFDSEISKAGLSADTPGLREMKQWFDKEIQGAKSVEEKLRLYNGFIEGLKGNVWTTIAEEMRNQKDYKKVAEKEAEENKKNTQNSVEAMRKMGQELKERQVKANEKRMEVEQKQWEKAKEWWNREAQIAQWSAREVISKWPA